MQELPERLLRPNDAAKFLGIGRTKLYELAKDPNFPKKVQLGTKSVGWWMSELKAYVNNLNKKEVA